MEQELLERADKLAQRLSDIGGEAWQAAVEYTGTCAAVAILASVVMLIVGTCAGGVGYRKVKTLDPDSSGFFAGEMLIVFGLAIMVIGVAVFFCNLPVAVCPDGATLFKLLRGV